MASKLKKQGKEIVKIQKEKVDTKQRHQKVREENAFRKLPRFIQILIKGKKS